MINLKDIKSAKHISDPTEEKLNDLKLVSQETDKEIVSTQGENTKDILRARSIERLDALDIDSATFNSKIGERETSVSEELSEITNSTEKVISDSEKYTEDIEAFLSVAKGDDFLFFLDDCTRPVGRLDKLTNGSYLCYGKKITSWDIPLPVLENGSNMFDSSTLDTNWNVSLPSLTNGIGMFKNCSWLTKWDVDLPSLTNVNGGWKNGMFSLCEQLVSFAGDLSSLTDGSHMFKCCRKLQDFTSNFSSLKTSYYMFSESGLKNWNILLPVLVNGSYMFRDSTLETFDSDTPSMTNGDWAFENCKNLYSFKGDLSSLTTASAMFNNCKLDLISIKNIAITINDLASQNKTGNITIGIQADLRGNLELAEALAAIVAKGWIVTEQYN